MINNDRVYVIRPRTRWTFDADESLLPHFRCSTVIKMDEHENTTFPSFGERISAVIV